MKRTVSLFIVCALMAVMFAVPTFAETQDFTGTTVRLAQQYGLHYAPVYVMERLGILEKYLPGATLEWRSLGGGSAMNEALISGTLDVAFMGIPPVLIAWDKGATYKIAAGICVPPSELMVKGDSIKSIADLTEKDKIAVPSIGSIQHIMLAIAAERELGNSHALDNNLVAMANPDAYAALISGTEVVGHFASMPYIDKELQDGMTSILTAKQAFADQASILCVATEAIHGNEAVYNGLMAALEEAIALINEQGEEVLNIIAEVEKITPEQALQYLNWEGTIYSTELYGVQGLADFMVANEFIKTQLNSVDEVVW